MYLITILNKIEGSVRSEQCSIRSNNRAISRQRAGAYAPEIVEGYFHQSPLRVVILSAIHGLNVGLKPVLIGMLGPIGLVVDRMAFTA